eukprot:snap_masked-scaffold_1-processed-gene-4.50-mRNA-1 protein AED:1.00 eAED:1.00 QI:0/0/0/0/1/1/2/0/63
MERYEHEALDKRKILIENKDHFPLQLVICYSKQSSMGTTLRRTYEIQAKYGQRTLICIRASKG